MKSIFLLLFLFFVASVKLATSATNSSEQGVKEKQGIKEKKVQVNFSDLLVRGKYSFSDKAVITVEADKVLDSLLAPKKNFNERIKRSANR